MSKTFADDFVELYKKHKSSKKYFPNDLVYVLLHQYLQINASFVESSLETFFDGLKEVDERDIKFALDVARITDRKASINKKIFDITLSKKIIKCSAEFRGLLMQHFSTREAPVFENYLKCALDVSSPIVIGKDDAKYLAKKILKSKITLTRKQSDFLLKSFANTKIEKEGQYLVYLKTLDYLAVNNPKGYEVFEQKIDELYSDKNVNYIFTTPNVIISILNTCSNPDLKCKMAKRFLVPPYSSNRYIQRAISSKIPEIQKLLNFQ